MRRREALSLLGAAGAAWPFTGRAQPGPIKRIGFIAALAESDPELQARLLAFRTRLAQLGWIEQRDLQIDLRPDAVDMARIRSVTADMTASRPDVIVLTNGATAGALQEAGGDIPVVFMGLGDPIGSGFVESLARPGGRMTGFTLPEALLGGKWLELLREIAPDLRQAAILTSPLSASSARQGYVWSIEEAARGANVGLTTALVERPEQIDEFLDRQGLGPSTGLIVTPGFFAARHRGRIISAAARNKLPAVYPFKAYAASGGLMYYGVDFAQLHRQAADYVDRILRGTRPADLPVQMPTKFELVINLNAARALGLDVPPFLLARADVVIE